MEENGGTGCPVLESWVLGGNIYQPMSSDGGLTMSRLGRARILISYMLQFQGAKEKVNESMIFLMVRVDSSRLMRY